MNAKEKFYAIDQTKISAKAKGLMKQIETKTEKFVNEDIVDVLKPTIDKLYAKIKAEKPEAILSKTKAKAKVKKKTRKQPTATKRGVFTREASAYAKKNGIPYKEAMKKLSAERKKESESNAKKVSNAFDEKVAELLREGKITEANAKRPKSTLLNDASRKAKPILRRSKSGKMYREYRKNRTDELQGQGYPMLAKGGLLSRETDYISNRDIISVTYKKGGKERTIKGSDMLDGIYVSKVSNAFGSGASTKKSSDRWSQVEDTPSGWRVSVSVGGEYKLFNDVFETEAKAEKFAKKWVERNGGEYKGVKNVGKALVPSNVITRVEKRSYYWNAYDSEDRVVHTANTKKELMDDLKSMEKKGFIDIDLKSAPKSTLGVGSWVVNKKGASDGRGRIYKVDGDFIYLEDEWGNKSNKKMRLRNFKALKNPPKMRHKFYVKYDGEDYVYYGTDMSEVKRAFIKENKVPKSKQWSVFVNSEKFYDQQDFRFMEKGGRISVVNEGEVFDASKYPAIMGDFDSDGLLNADDPKPRKYESNKKQIEQVKFTDTFAKLLTLKKELDGKMNVTIDELDEIAPDGSKIYARTKTPYSILKKLVEKRLTDKIKGLTDLVGTTIATDDYKDLAEVDAKIKKGVLGKVVEREDMYKTPKAGYRAIHYLVDVDGTIVEVQLKTKRMKAVNEISHDFYKKGTLNGAYLKKLTGIVARADKGNASAIRQYDGIMKNKSKLKRDLQK